MNPTAENSTSPRRESDREDIMREATALKRRASFRIAGLPAPIVVGFRRNNYFSVFFDQDPVYQFDDAGRLRRAYRDGLLYRTQGTTLAKLTRVRTTDQTILQREDLDETDLASFLNQMTVHTSALLRALEGKQAELLEVVPADADLTTVVTGVLRQIVDSDGPLAPALPARK